MMICCSQRWLCIVRTIEASGGGDAAVLCCMRMSYAVSKYECRCICECECR